MKLLTKSRKKAARNMYVKVSNHYQPSTFGVRGKYETEYKTGQYMECGTPGTGFFIRSTSSHAYREYCKLMRKKQQNSYWDFVFGKEFDFNKEMERAEKALSECHDELRSQILESYLNVLPLAMEALEGEKILEAVKALAHKRHKTTTYQKEVMTSYKSSISRLRHDCRELQLHQSNLCSEEQYNRFSHVVIPFTNLCSSRRIWHSREVSVKNLSNTFKQVYFDMGIFNYIQMPLMTPMMRDSQGSTYWLYPKFLVAARDAVDFDVYPLTSLSFLFRQVPYENISSMILDSYADSSFSESSGSSHHHQHVQRRNYEEFGSGLLVNGENDSINEKTEEEETHRERVVAELYIPEIKLRYYARDVKAMKHFVDALNDYIKEGIDL
ncbi:MAG: hypothetical protein KBT28_07285 [Bacteroidales bacterium]|nr:hypothetical protein [Candidatus Colimorpha merdihippi]